MTFERISYPGLLPKERFSDLSICITGYYEKAYGHYCKRDAVSEYQVAYCVAGRGTIICAGRQIDIKAGDIFINIPGHPHEYWADENDPWTHYWVHFAGTAAERYFQIMGCRPDEPAFALGPNERLVDLYKEMHLLLQHDDLPHQLQALSILHNILSLVIMLRREFSLGQKTHRSGIPLNMPAIEQFIRDRAYRVALPELAEVSAMSVPHFVRTFKHKTGYSPMQYVARKKITLACQIITHEPSLSIKEVSNRVGLDDQHYFSRLFKKVSGMSPLQYRQMALR